jgi:hypothetical protein
MLSVRCVASGKRYDHEAVAPETYFAFRDAFAKGRLFNAHIRIRFRFEYRRVGEQDDSG